MLPEAVLGRILRLLMRDPHTDSLFEGAGLQRVELVPIDRDFDDYWTSFLAGGAPAPAYCMSLDEDRRAVLRERLRATLPTGRDGSIHLSAQAWAVQGTA
jgi:hypothetical protein